MMEGWLDPAQARRLEAWYARSGVWTDGYVPLFRYLGGLDGEGEPDEACHALALVANDEFILCRCHPALCDEPGAAGFFRGVGDEIGRIPKSELAEIHVFAPSSVELRPELLATRLMLKPVNKLMGHYGLGKVKPALYQWILVLRCWDGVRVRDVSFGMPPPEKKHKLELGLEPKELAMKLLPEDVREPVELFKKTRALIQTPKVSAEAMAAAEAIAQSLAMFAGATR